MKSCTLVQRCALVAAVSLLGCGVGSSDTSTNTSGSKTVNTDSPESILHPDERYPVKLNASHLPNAVQVHTKVISGGQPDGEAAFQELQKLGVKTVISVDGAAPDLELARKYGLRYVHLPHGYDGIPEHRVQELAKAVRDFDGPIYIHCHHGKHRSPAAAATACISAGLIDKSQAAAILKIAGTNPNYRGLFEVTESAGKLDDAILDSIAAQFPEIATLPPAAEAMVALEHTQDRLKAFAASGWKTLDSDPSLKGSHEALLLQEHFTEMLRTDWAKQQAEKFQTFLSDSEQAASDLESGLRTWEAAGFSGEIPEVIPVSFERISKSCTACHQQFRDIPLKEKARKL